MKEEKRNTIERSPIDTESRIFNFVNQFLESYKELKLNRSYLNTEDILKILAESLNSSVAFVSNPIQGANRFRIIYLYKESGFDISLSTGSEFEFNTELINKIQEGNPYALEEDSVEKCIPDLHNKGMRNLFAIQYQGPSALYILIIGDRKERPQGTAVYYVNHEALISKIFMEITGIQQFDEHLKTYAKIRLAGYRTSLLRAIDALLIFKSYLEKQNVLDNYLFKSLDLKIALQVRPSKIAQREDIQEFFKALQNKMSKTSEKPLPNLALIRGFSWLYFKKTRKEWIESINNPNVA